MFATPPYASPVEWGWVAPPQRGGMGEAQSRSPGTTVLMFGGAHPKPYTFPTPLPAAATFSSPGSLQGDLGPAVWMITALATNQRLDQPKLFSYIRKVTAVAVLIWELFWEGKNL